MRGTATTSIKLTLTADYEAFQASSGIAAIVRLNPRELATIHINLDAVGTTDNLEWAVFAGSKEPTGGDYDEDGQAGALIVELETALHPMTTDDEFVGLYLNQTNGGEAGEFRLIIDATASNDRVTLDHALSGVPSAGELYDLYRFSIWDSGTIIPLTTVTVDNPQNAMTTILGPDFFVVLARRSGSTDAQIAYMTYQLDGVSA